MEAGRLLEIGVLADLKGEPATETLEAALAKLKESRKAMDALYAKFGDMRRIEQNNNPLPEHIAALARILKAYPPVERVNLVNSRFANVSQADLLILEKEHDNVIEAFEAVLPSARNGGFAAIVLSGRAPLPERIMHSADQMLVYVHYVDRACMASIAADMQVYPKGLEWIPKAGWMSEKKPSGE